MTQAQKSDIAAQLQDYVNYRYPDHEMFPYTSIKTAVDSEGWTAEALTSEPKYIQRAFILKYYVEQLLGEDIFS